MVRTVDDCGFGDVACQVSNSANQTLNDFAATLASWLGGLLRGSLNADSQITIFTGTGNGGTFANAGFQLQYIFWLSIMIGVVLLVGLVQIAIAIPMGDMKKIGRVAVAMLLSVPTTSLALVMFDQTNRFFNAVTDQFITQITVDGDGGLPRAMLNMTGLGAYMVSDDVSADPWALAADMTMQSATGIFTGGIGPLGSICVIGLLLLACLFLAVAMLVRIFGLAVLATLLPIAIMFVGQPKLNAWAARWVEVTLGLLLAKPLAAAVIGVAIAIGGGAPAPSAADGTVVTGFFGIVAGFVGLLLAAASPAVTIGLVRFASTEIQQSVAKRPSLSQAAYKGQLAMGAGKGVGRLLGGLGRGGRASVGGGRAAAKAAGRGIGGGKGNPGSPGQGKPGSPGTSGRGPRSGSTNVPPTRSGSSRRSQGPRSESRSGSFYSRRNPSRRNR